MVGGEIARHSGHLLERGFTVLEGVSAAEIRNARACVVENAHLLKNTRPNVSSGHLAGFHRYPDLEPLHRLVSSNPDVLEILRSVTNSGAIRSIGLSDITVNRSQPWHVDLLRGKYRGHLTPDICWGPNGGGVYKVLLYLQAGATLRVVPGAHRKPVPLDDDSRSKPLSAADTAAVDVKAGGIVLMDIRLPHRGSSEEELSKEEFAADPKILISTVLGDEEKPLTRAMEKGNLDRLLDWDLRHLDADKPRLSPPQELVEPATQS